MREQCKNYRLKSTAHHETILEIIESHLKVELIQKFEHMGTQDDVENLCEKLGHVLDRDFGNLRCRKFAKTIFKERDKLFLFVTNPEVDGTNNRAERAVRPNVVYRKICGGTRSAEGTKRYAELASVVQTLKLKGSNFVGKGLEIIRTSG